MKNSKYPKILVIQKFKIPTISKKILKSPKIFKDLDKSF